MPVRKFHDYILDPFQEKAIEALEAGKNVIVCAPTGAGKTLIAEYAIDHALKQCKRVIYTAPIKALSNQKFRDFTTLYPGKVGIVTGDVRINYPAPCAIMTTEIFRNTVIEDPESVSDVAFIIFDEFHYIDDVERGTVWEESVIFSPDRVRFLCLSATIPNHSAIAEWMEDVKGVPVEVIVEEKRPVKLTTMLWVEGVGAMGFKEFRQFKRFGKFRKGREDRIIELLTRQDKLPCLYFCFSRALCEKKAKSYGRHQFLTREERREVLELFDSLAGRYGIADDPQVEELRALVSRGIAYHHAGMLPTLKEIVERLFTTGLIKLLVATETFALGVNMPARTVVLDSLKKFDGVRTTYLRTREFQQMSGRAGRRGMDERGFVYARLGRFDSNIKSIREILFGETEPILSQFSLSYSTILQTYSSLGDELFDLVEKSFVNYQGRYSRKARQFFSQQLRKRFKVLQKLGYIHQAHLTSKGDFAGRIQGYELQVAEFFFRGFLEEAKPPELAVIFSAITYEPRKGQSFEMLPHSFLRELRPRLAHCIQHIRLTEARTGVVELTRKLDFSLGAPIYAWSTGADFDEVMEYTTADAGDIIRSFRFVVQLLRQTAQALDGHPSLQHRLYDAMKLINRDEVDAERQLRLAISLE